MNKQSQQSNCSKNAEKADNPSVTYRIIAFIVFLCIISGFFLGYLGGRGILDLTDLFGICGFQQRYQLPCPGCFWTRSVQEFSQGHIPTAFYIQPAAAFFCCLGVVTGVFALLASIFGVRCRFLCRLVKAVGIKYLIVSVIFIIIMGWAVTLARALSKI